jgi:MFS family permease
MQAAESPPGGPERGVSQPVRLLAFVSFLTDISSEMIYPLIPLFLTSSLGAPAAAVGLIEGLAESTASLTKTISGWLSDRLHVRKPLVVLGYGLSALGKPLLAASYGWPAALGARFVDRLGKGIRTAPRDALIGDVTHEESRGLAFAFHRAADTLGAVAGPAIGLGLFLLLDESYRTVFLLAFIPAAAGVLMLLRLRERPPAKSADGGQSVPLRRLGRPFYIFLAISLLFAFGNSSDVFLILRAADLGLSDAAAVGAYIAFNAVYALAAVPAGVASDRLGRRNVIATGFIVFSVVYFGFALAGNGAAAWPLFALYGVYMALTEAVGKAFVIDFAPAPARATALGLYSGAIGAMVLVSSVTAGVLWDVVGPSAPFLLGGLTGLAAFALLVAFLPRASAAQAVRP